MEQTAERARNISKTMLAYLKRAREYKEFLLRESQEFERGKRHLANIMGVKSDEMTQEDIDDAIRYLFPSGLFDKRARPMMKHPDLLFKSQKDAQFDVEGRPHHYLFYTALPNYYEALVELRKNLTKLNDFEDKQLADGILDPPSEAKYQLFGRKWLTLDQVSNKFIENIKQSDYDYLIRSLEKLQSHPYSDIVKPFLDSFTEILPGQSSNLVLPEILRDEATGEIYCEIVEQRHAMKLSVKTVLNGSGKIDILGFDILFFTHPYMRTSLLMPLRIAGMQDRVDIIARLVSWPKELHMSLDHRVHDMTAIAGAIRQAVSRSLAAYLDSDIREKLRIAGLLERDHRNRERKKFGQKKARRKYTWKKR